MQPAITVLATDNMRLEPGRRVDHSCSDCLFPTGPSCPDVDRRGVLPDGAVSREKGCVASGLACLIKG